ncbi:MAG: M28 family peptidase [Ignavibacteriaceae bacterium]|nr:M28 family peptidase [Ignavibacteriaceae bacterium]
MKLLLITLLLQFSLFSQPEDVYLKVAGSALLNNHSYSFLQKLTDEAGGRLPGSESNKKGIKILQESLSELGISSKLENFNMPGWFRGNDIVKLVTPEVKILRSAALGYTGQLKKTTAEVIFAGHGYGYEYENLDVKSKIVIVTQEAPPGKEELFRFEMIDSAAEKGAIAILIINKAKGGKLLLGTGNFQGVQTKIPAFTVTFEEGKRLERLIKAGVKVEIEIEVNSYCEEIISQNIVVTFPGKSKSKIVVGAHFDGWDIGQGAVDNGLGTAILFEIARLINQFSPGNFHTIELVWFNGEETGLWGSKKYVEAHRNEDIRIMINMDMTGYPTGINVMGFSEMMPIAKNIVSLFNGFELRSGVTNSPWTNSDHMPFMLAGIPTFGINATLDEPMSREYHDLGDSFDKVSKNYLSAAAAFVAVSALKLANAEDLPLIRKDENEVMELLRKYNLENRLRRQGEIK